MKKAAYALVVLGFLSGSAAYGYDPQGAGKVSDGNCNCKSQCDAFARAGQLAGAKLAQCKSDCQQKFAGCNKGAQR